MKKLIISMLALFSCAGAYALPVGNPTEASLFLNGIWCESSGCCDPCNTCFNWCDAWSFRVGFYGDYVFNRNMEVDASGTNVNGRDIRTTQINTNAGYVAFNLCDRADVFATFGASHIFIQTNSKALGTITDPEGLWAELDFETTFSWSIGGRATIWECGCFGVGVEGQYFQTRPDLDYFRFYDTGEEQFINLNNHTRYREWQVGLGASYRFATRCPTIAMTPYMAVKWSKAKLFTDDPTQIGNTLPLRDLESQKLWGYAIGMSLTLCDVIGVTVEGRFADEKAVYVNGEFRF